VRESEGRTVAVLLQWETSGPKRFMTA
jgi:hypothetical protein